MNLFVPDAIFPVFRIRGHIPGHDDFDGGPGKSSPAGNTGRITRILTVFAVVAALLSLVVWTAVWLTIKSL
jgi:hypothetical protein